MKVLQRRERIDTLGSVLFVAFDERERLERALLRGLDVAYPVLVDRDRSAYRSWGLGRGSIAGVWGDPRVWLLYTRKLLGGERLRRPGRDTLQLGGDFVLDPQGIVTYARPQQRDDRPPVAELLRALERAARTAD
ncbi:MAG TPA: AhpC/TSA family protein [Gaiellaceae bacterium]|nr:AhpC/TSA family protein [Gaiellaceae bacterium]